MYGDVNTPQKGTLLFFFSNVHHTYSCIDLFMVDKFMLQKIVKSNIHVITWSDHAPISISVGDQGIETRDGGMISLLYPNQKI